MTLTYHARDVNGYEVQGLKLTTRTEGVKDVTLSEWKDNGDGSYTQEVTAGRTAGTVSLMPQVKGSDAAKDAVQLTLTAGDMVADKSTVSVQPASIKADGAEATTVTYQARDAHGNLVPLQATDVTLSVSGVEATTFSGFTESVPGVYVGTLTGTRTGTASLMPQVNGSDAAKDAAQLTLTAGAPYANSSTVTLAATSLTVGDTHTTTATWTVKDEHNNPVTGLTDATLNVTSQTEGVTVTATAWAEDINSPGTYTATVTAGDKAGTVRLMPQVNGSDAAKDAAQLTLTAGDMVADKSTVSVQPASIKADGAEATTVTYQARDAHGNLVPLQATDVTLSVSGVDETTFSGFTESVPGVYVGTLTGTRTGTASLMPQVNGSDAAKEAAQLMLTAGAPVSNTSSISTNKTGYTVGESMTVTVMLKDAHG
ncbi:Ig-like domain-containing protein, partial [Escherichia coli]|uniref:Ig-like domain-containing protein n=2 Tax=Escherichia coli TaxID=562 RepID=UPI00201A290D